MVTKATKRLSSTILILVLTIIVSACCKKREYCPSERMNIAFVGFYRTEIKLVLLKRYKKWERGQVLDSATLSYNGPTTIPKVGEDTVWLSDYITQKGLLDGIKGGNDWVIEIWGARRKYRITDMLDAGHYSELISCSDKKTTCENAITGFNVDDTVKYGNTLHIRK